MIGEYNVLNASAAAAVLNLGVKTDIIKKALKNYSGVQRRMTKVLTKKIPNEFFDDYTHHPTEISSILEGVRKVYNNRKIISVFRTS